MPLYTYLCPAGHARDLLRHRDAVTAPCACGATAARREVNRVAVIGQAETPRDERTYRHEYAEYSEAVAEVADFYGRKRANGDPVREPDYYGLAKAQTAAKGAEIRG